MSLAKLDRCAVCGRRRLVADLVESIVPIAHEGETFPAQLALRCANRKLCASPPPFYADKVPMPDADTVRRLKLMDPCPLCRAVYTWAQFFKLPPPINGSQMPGEDEQGNPLTLELRQCGCENTLCRTEPKS